MPLTQNIETIISSKKIDEVLALMENKSVAASAALCEYNTSAHNIHKRKDKIILNRKKEYMRTQRRWRLPIPYQTYINEIALVFLYGRPVKWLQQSEDTAEAFDAFKKLVKETHFNSKIRQCKRLAGAETQSALLFHLNKNKAGDAKLQLKVLSKSGGDDIHTLWDQYGNLILGGWGYRVKTPTGTENHLELYSSSNIYRCRHSYSSWEVQTAPNLLSKIPMIIFEQPKEWQGVQEMIEREEYIVSKTADVNDYFADPAVVATADIINSLPEKDSESKLYILKEKGQIQYLTWDSSPEAKQRELEWLQKHILSKTFTPNIDFDNMKGLSNVSAKALKQMMILADIKAAKHKEVHEELLSRIASLFRAAISNVLDYSLKAQCDKLSISHEFQEPFGEDIQATLQQLIDSKYAKGMSTETFLEMHPLIKDAKQEMGRLQKEEQEARNTADDIFGRGV